MPNNRKCKEDIRNDIHLFIRYRYLMKKIDTLRTVSRTFSRYNAMWHYKL